MYKLFCIYLAALALAAALPAVAGAQAAPDSSAKNPTTTDTGNAVIRNGARAATAQAPERKFGIGLRISVLDKTTLFLQFRPIPQLNLELAGFGKRKKTGEAHNYTYRAQAEADVLFLPQARFRPFIGLRYGWEEFREEESSYYYATSASYPPYSSYHNYRKGTINRIGLCIGADIAASRVGVQIGLTPLYDSKATTTRVYPTYGGYPTYTMRDTMVTDSEASTVMDYGNFYVTFRFCF